MAEEQPVVIIGAGLAGLACAITLQKKNKSFLLLEKACEVGGRIKTTKTESGFLLDHGFQVLLTSYPELKNFLDLQALELKTFNSGALVYTPEKTKLLANPFVHPSQIFSEVLSGLVSIKDKALILKLVFVAHTGLAASQESSSTLNFLRTFGFSQDFIALFWSPFCAGVFLDSSLEVDSKYFLFLLKYFSTGRVAIPKDGMQQIPIQMSSQINAASIKLGVEVKEYTANTVTLASGELIRAQAVVCAFDRSKGFRSVINYYFSTARHVDWEKWLLLIPAHYGFRINNVTVMSNVSEAYSETGKHLISVSIVGSDDPGEIVVTSELNQISGVDLELNFIEKFVINKALPKEFTQEETHMEDGIYYCGDYLSSPSINGALSSGRLTAEKILGKNLNVYIQK